MNIIVCNSPALLDYIGEEKKKASYPEVPNHTYSSTEREKPYLLCQNKHFFRTENPALLVLKGKSLH